MTTGAAGLSDRTDSRQGNRALLVNSTVAMCLAQIIVIALHETSHSVAGLALGYQAIQYTGSVSFLPEPGDHDAALTAITGPLFSLITGVSAVLLIPFHRIGGFARLLALWVAFMSAEEGFGYFTVSAVLTAGDTGRAFSIWGVPGWGFALATAFGIAGLFFLAYRFGREGARLTADVHGMRNFCFYPWLLGTLIGVITSVLSLLAAGSAAIQPGDAVAIVAGSISIAVFAPMAMMFWRKVQLPKSPISLARPTAPIIVTVVLALVNILVMSRGITLG